MHNVEPMTSDQAAAAAQGAHVAPERAASKKAASRKDAAHKGRKTANGGKTDKPKVATAKKSVKAGGKATKAELGKRRCEPRT